MNLRRAQITLATYLDPPIGQHFLDVAQAQGEAQIGPDRMAYDVRRTPMPLE